MKMVTIWALALLMTTASSVARSAEADYQRVWCGQAGGQTEVVLEDRSRVDCITEYHAIEFDFGRKWGESVGQALNYGMYTGRRPGVVLILEQNNETEQRYVDRVLRIKCHYNIPITIWVMTSLNPAEIDWSTKSCNKL